jgi:hypothetical protein
MFFVQTVLLKHHCVNKLLLSIRRELKEAQIKCVRRIKERRTNSLETKAQPKQATLCIGGIKKPRDY